MTDIKYMQETQQTQPYQNYWWEIELARKELRIDELELRLGCCRDASTGKDLLIAALEKRIAELDRDKCIGPDCNKPRLWRGLGFENTTVTTGGLTARIAELEAQVSGYAHVLDDAYDGYMSASSTEELVEVLKEVIEYAPRREA